MQLLLDTHLLVWAMGEPERPDPTLVRLLEDAINTPVFSETSLGLWLSNVAWIVPTFIWSLRCCARPC